MKQPTLEPSLVDFPNGGQASLLHVPAAAEVAAVPGHLGIATDRPVIILIGGADLDASLELRLSQLFSHGIVAAAQRAGAILIDGGTDAGVMSLLGRAAAHRDQDTPLIGVTPAARVTYPGAPDEGDAETRVHLEPHHSHFLLVAGQDWGDETDTMYRLADALSAGQPVVTILVNGGVVARNEALRSARRGWPVLILEGSGRLADELSGLWRERPVSIAEPAAAELIADGDIHLFPPDGNADSLEKWIAGLLRRDTPLRLAWERFALFDSNAGRQQKSFGTMQRWILSLGVAGTLLALSQSEWMVPLQGLSLTAEVDAHRVLRFIIILIPISIAALTAVTNRFYSSSSYIAFRGGAESIKREIFRYRTRTGAYADDDPRKREMTLAERTEEISDAIASSEEQLVSLGPYSGPVPPQYGAAPGDDGFRRLTPEAYLESRLDDQLLFYRSRVVSKSRQLRSLQWLIYIVGGLGTLLAALGQEVWIALTTAIVTAVTSFLGGQQVESTVVKYSQAAVELGNVKAWWAALGPQAQSRQEAVDQLVDRTETVLMREHSQWVKQLAEATTERSEAPGDAAEGAAEQA